jgi:NAD(P)H-dependent FMN reductase
MNESRRAFILTGSTRVGRTTSQSVGEYLAERLAERDVQFELMRVRNAQKSERGISDMLAEIEHADVFILVFPLFVSNLPAMVIRVLEAIAERRGEGGVRKPIIAREDIPRCARVRPRWLCADNSLARWVSSGLEGWPLAADR